ncbi:MAG: 23S rRNA (pseudouridine(1915)-N(3))-methyltransferase RlmH [Candidatus Woesearchaeota archaeon]|nr:23S rRNA (pseudouridine(1915)-N(3))-methyltransferase RlmH [Candidatus Woesearchaeota archaeon]
MKIICVGKIKDKNIISLIDEYSKRIDRTTFIEIKDSDPMKEGEKIIETLEKIKDKHVFVLSEEGREFSSIEFAQKLKKIEKEIVFVIGGPFGLSDEVKKKADVLFSLSRMTFTHEMARLFLIEQVYRAISINDGKKYHKT